MIAFIIFMGFISIIVLPTVIWLYALVDVIRNDFRHFSTKIGVIVFTGLTAYDTWKIKDTEHALKRRVLYEF